MKLRPLFATVIGSALLSAGAYAAGDPATQQRKSQAGQDRSMSQPQGMQQDKAQSSETVRKAQQALKDKGFDAGPVDGIMGPQTKQAVKKFQESQASLKDTGQLDQQTLSALGVEGQGSAAMGSASGTPRGAGAPPAAGAPAAGGPGGAKQPDQKPNR